MKPPRNAVLGMAILGALSGAAWAQSTDRAAMPTVAAAASSGSAVATVTTTSATTRTITTPSGGSGSITIGGSSAATTQRTGTLSVVGNGNADAGPRGGIGAGADAGGSGRVGAAIAPGAIGLSAADFASLDANHDGLLTPGELSDSGASSRFADFDLDGNGTLSRAEWQAFVATSEQ